MSEIKLKWPDGIPQTEFSAQFLQGMLDRMAMSFHKYGAVAEAYPHKVDAIFSGQDRVRKYIETGNTEFLIDDANFKMIEFMHPRKEGAFFKSTTDEESPGRVKIGGPRTLQRNEDLR